MKFWSAFLRGFVIAVIVIVLAIVGDLIVGYLKSANTHIVNQASRANITITSPNQYASLAEARVGPAFVLFILVLLVGVPLVYLLYSRNR